MGTNVSGGGKAAAQQINRELYKRNAELAVRNKTLALLRKLDEVSLRAIGIEVTAQEIAKAIAQEFGYEVVSIATIAPKKELRWLAFASSSNTLLTAPQSQIRVNPNILNKNSFVRGIATVLPKSIIERINATTGKKISSSLLYPLFLEKKPVGLIVFSAVRDLHTLSTYEHESIEGIVSLTSLALYKAKLFETLQMRTEQLRQASEALQIANTRLKKLDQAKTEFLSIASHQLRSPMTGIKGYMSMLTEGDFGKLSPQQTKVMSNIMVNTEGLIQLVNLFLDVTRIEEGRFDLIATKTNIEQMALETIEQLKPQALTKHLALKLVVPKESIAPVIVDQQKIKQVFVNLIDNAIKYTPSGTVTLTIYRSNQPPRPPKKYNANFDKGSISGERINICVSDTGVGLEQADIDQLYQKFFRVQGAAQVFTGGSGLGLFVVKKIVELHGGDLAVWSAGKNKGSSFCFSIGYKPARVSGRAV